MSGGAVPDRVETVDRRGWIVATLVTIVLFTASIRLTNDVQFSAVAGAGAGIAVQFLLPYWVRLSVPPEAWGSEDRRAVGSAHGAAGGALLVGSVAALAVTALRMDSTVGLVAGSLLAVVSYVPLRSVLPDR